MVLLRRRGKFKAVAQAGSPEQAFSIGKRFALTTAAASFKVSHEGKIISPRLFSKKFRTSKKEPGVVIQKRRFRIGTPGEKKEITYKGILSQKVKSKKANIFGGIL